MTIDERATSYIVENEYTEKEACIAYAAYCAGARENESFDIDKACEWLRKNVRPYYKFSIESFRKAMEE